MKEYKVSSDRACDGQKVENITCSMEIAQQIAESAKEAGHTNIIIEEVEEEQTMKNTKSMTKREAIASIVSLDAGMLAKIFGSTKYEVIDDGINKMIVTAADQMHDSDFEGCKNWIDVLFTINRWSEHKNWYLTGNADYREYMIKYGYEEAKTILRNYIQTVLNEGIATTRPESEYIRGAKDALCIA
jgi:hypothetical protein